MKQWFLTQYLNRKKKRFLAGMQKHSALDDRIRRNSPDAYDVSKRGDTWDKYFRSIEVHAFEKLWDTIKRRVVLACKIIVGLSSVGAFITGILALLQ